MKNIPLGYWIPTALFALAITGSGVINLLSPPEILAAMDHLHYPAWFGKWLGLWKLAGAIVVLAPGLPRLKEWATAGFTIALSSAAVSHLAAGDGLGQAAPPLVLLALALTSWALRPEGRRLAAS